MLAVARRAAHRSTPRHSARSASLCALGVARRSVVLGVSAHSASLGSLGVACHCSVSSGVARRSVVLGVSAHSASLGSLGVACHCSVSSGVARPTRHRSALGVVRREVFDDKPPDARLFNDKFRTALRTRCRPSSRMPKPRLLTSQGSSTRHSATSCLPSRRPQFRFLLLFVNGCFLSLLFMHVLIHSFFKPIFCYLCIGSVRLGFWAFNYISFLRVIILPITANKYHD